MITPLRTTARRITLRKLQSSSFSTTKFPHSAPNRIFDPIRSTSELSNLLVLSNSRPLITFWTASWCPSCKAVRPNLLSLIQDSDFGAKGLGFAEVEFDAPGGDLALEAGGRYQISSIPTLLTFDGGEPVMSSKVMGGEQMRDVAWLRRWLENEAKRGGRGKGLFGNLFGGT